jgi:deazaflavin-dependent oxidoreductase (nitroreductase family)
VFGPIGVPLLLPTTTGRKSGRRRQTPLIYMREGDRLYIIGTNYGQATHPAWSSNLLARPESVGDHGRQGDSGACEPSAGCRARSRLRMFATYNTKVFDSYRSRTDRYLPVFALTSR